MLLTPSTPHSEVSSHVKGALLETVTDELFNPGRVHCRSGSGNGSMLWVLNGRLMPLQPRRYVYGHGAWERAGLLSCYGRLKSASPGSGPVLGHIT